MEQRMGYPFNLGLNRSEFLFTFRTLWCNPSDIEKRCLWELGAFSFDR
jgi:hypothetical protein